MMRALLLCCAGVGGQHVFPRREHGVYLLFEAYYKTSQLDEEGASHLEDLDLHARHGETARAPKVAEVRAAQETCAQR